MNGVVASHCKSDVKLKIDGVYLILANQDVSVSGNAMVDAIDLNHSLLEL